MTSEPFERQPKPVTVVVTGETQDVMYWARELARRGESHGDMVQMGPGYHESGKPSTKEFTIYPRAVNE
jgi:hypothetical protein